MSLFIFLSEHLFVSPCSPVLVHHVLRSPARAPNSSTAFPTSHTPKRSIRLSTLHSNPPFGLPLKLTPKILLHTISACPPLPSHPPSTTHTRSKERTKTASCCEAGRRHEANGFLERPRRLQDAFSTTESLQVARHPLAHDRFQFVSKFDSTKKILKLLRGPVGVVGHLFSPQAR